MRRRTQPRRFDDRVTEEVVVFLDRLARAHADANPERLCRGTVVMVDRLLHPRRSRERAGSATST